MVFSDRNSSGLLAGSCIYRVRCRASCSRSVAKLSVPVFTPALDGGIAEKRTGIVRSGPRYNANRCGHATYGDRRTAVGYYLISELPVLVFAPALHFARPFPNRTAMEGSRSQSGGMKSTSERDRASTI